MYGRYSKNSPWTNPFVFENDNKMKLIKSIEVLLSTYSSFTFFCRNKDNDFHNHKCIP